MELHTWLLYLAASIGLSLSPGPNGLLALTHGALHGQRKALFTISGGVLGFTVIIALSLFGIGALLQASIVWLTALKWAGGAYLVWLGIQLWRAPAMELGAAKGGERPGSALFKEGLLSAVTNPKALLFFAAFLPQFIEPTRDLIVQFVVMAGTFGAVEFAYEWIVASAAHRVRPLLRRLGRRFNQACGGIFAAIGIAMPLRG
ncbi:MAG TPA: LysE family transporter [Usitatibacter sp.]|nr:LysE family transporter [Usitatibacter sp.]